MIGRFSDDFSQRFGGFFDPNGFAETDIAARFDHPNIFSHRVFPVRDEGIDGFGDQSVKLIIIERQITGVRDTELKFVVDPFLLRPPAGAFYHLW